MGEETGEGPITSPRAIEDYAFSRAQWLIAMDSEIFQAVLDESGYEAADSRHPNDAFVFAGYMGKVSDWANFTHSWKPIIDQHPELRDTDFMKALMRWHGGRSHPLAVDLMKAVTDNNGLGSIRWTLPYREFRKVVRAREHGLKEHVYFFAFSAVLFQVLGTVLQAESDARFDLIYDQNIHEEPRIQEAYQKYRAIIEKASPWLAQRMPLRPQPLTDAEYWPLRAADALAWNTHRHFIRAQKGRLFTNPLWRLMDSGPEAFKDTWSEQDVRAVLGTPQNQREFVIRKLERICKLTES
jgi:hypothetical protein